MQNPSHSKPLVLLIKGLLPSVFFQKSDFPLGPPDLPCVTLSVASASALLSSLPELQGMSIQQGLKNALIFHTKAHKVQSDEKQSKLWSAEPN